MAFVDLSTPPTAGAAPAADSPAGGGFIDLTQPYAPPAPPEKGFWGNMADAFVYGLKKNLTEGQQSATALAGGTPTPEAPSTAPYAQPVQWSDALHPSVLLPKLVAGLSESAPEIAGFMAGGAAGTALAPEAPGISAAVGGGVVAGAVSAFKKFGPLYAAELQKNPDDPSAAYDRALKQAGTGGVLTGASFGLFGLAPVKDAVMGALAKGAGLTDKGLSSPNVALAQGLLGHTPGLKAAAADVALQAGVVQPLAGTAGVMADNTLTDKPLMQGTLDALPGEVLGTAAPLAAHLGLHVITGSPKAIPDQQAILDAGSVDQAVERFKFDTSGNTRPPIDLTALAQTYKDHTPDEVAANQALLVRAHENEVGFGQDANGAPTLNDHPLQVVAPQALPDEGPGLTRATYEAKSAINEALGLKTVVYADDGSMPAGLVNERATPGTVFISDHPVDNPMAVNGHEVGHLFYNDPAFKPYLDAINGVLTDNSDAVARARHDAGRDVPLSDAAIANERASDIAADAWADPTFHEQVISKMQEQLGDKAAETNGVKFLDSIKNIIFRVKAVLTGTTFTSPDGQRLATQYVTDLTGVRDALAAALADKFIQKGYRPPGDQINTSQLLVRRALDLQAAKAAAAEVPGFQRTAEQVRALNTPDIQPPANTSESLKAGLDAATRPGALRTTAERLNLEAIKAGLRQSPKQDKTETLYRGEYTGNRGGAQYSPDREWARQFTQSGQDHEIKSVGVKTSDIFEPARPVYAGDQDAVDAAIVQARGAGFKAVRLDEGAGQPQSVTVFNKTALRPPQRDSGIQASPKPTPESERFIADSAIKTPMYHGTARDISEFKPKQAGAIFLTHDPKFAESFAGASEDWMAHHAGQFLTPDQRQEASDRAFEIANKDGSNVDDVRNRLLAEMLPTHANVMPVWVHAKNPFDYENAAHRSALTDRLEREGASADLTDQVKHDLPSGSWSTIEDPRVQAAIRANGHDGFYAQEAGRKNLGVYDSAQIKSATGNRGTFDRTNPDISMSPKRVDQPGRFVEDGNRLGFWPALRVQVPRGVAIPDRARILAGTTNDNASRQIATINDILARFPRAAESTTEWTKMMAFALASNEAPVPPYAFIRDINGSGALNKLRQLTSGQIADADHGFANAADFRRAYTTGQANIGTTGKLMLWSFLSRGISPYRQESMFIDAFKSADRWIDAAARGEFSDATLPAYYEWANSMAPKGSGLPGAGALANLNAFGRDFLIKMSQPGADGVTHMQRLHNMLADPNQTGKGIRREFAKFGEGVGIDNKVVSFSLLVAGHNDVMVLDRVQTRALWNDGKFDNYNLYDGTKNADGTPAQGSSLEALTSGARGLLVYEAIERALAAKVGPLYEALGRPQDASIGRYHWETWVADSQQEASHSTLGAILRDAAGDDTAIAQVYAKEGQYDAYQYGTLYGRDADGNPFFRYTTPNGEKFAYTVGAYRSFLEELKNPKNGVAPRDFRVTNEQKGADGNVTKIDPQHANGPWYNRPGVDQGKLTDLAAKWSDLGRPGAAESVRPEDTNGARPNTGAGATERGTQPPAEREGTVGAGVAGEPVGGELRQSPKRRDALDLTGVHFSTEPREMINGSFFGTGMRGAEAKRILESPDQRLHSRVYAYVNTGNGVTPERFVGGQAHTVNMRNLYDANSDPQNLVRLGGNAFESAVLDHGYDGYVTRGQHQGVAVTIGDASRAMDATNKGVGYRGEELEQPGPVTRTPTQQVADNIASDKSLPDGERSGAEWKQLLGDRAPAGLTDDKMYYKDQVAAQARLEPGIAAEKPGQSLVQASPKTPEFKKWFGDSKVVDDKGEPLVMYHGSKHDLHSIMSQAQIVRSKNPDAQSAGNAGNEGIYFTPDPQYAQMYSGSGDRRGPTYPVYLSIKHPLVLDAKPPPGPVARIVASIFSRRAERQWDEESNRLSSSMYVSREQLVKLQSLGYDGIINNKWKETVVFRPEQVKSAIGNSGAFDARNPDISKSPKPMPDWLKTMSPEAQEFSRKAGGWAEPVTFKDRWNKLADRAGLKFLQATTDSFLPIKTDIGEREYIKARMASSTDEALISAVTQSRIKINDAGALDVIPGTKSYQAVRKPLGHEQDRFDQWMAALRASELLKEGREHNFTPDQIKAGLKFNEGKMADGRDRAAVYAAVLPEEMAFNRSMLDIGLKAGLYSQKVYDILKDNIYIPFFREADKDGTPVTPHNFGGLVNQYGFKKLTGDTNVLRDLMANRMSNWSHILSASMKNLAADAILTRAEQLGAATKTNELLRDVKTGGYLPHEFDPTKSVFVMRNGTQVKYTVHDDLLVKALSSLDPSPFSGPIMKGLSVMKHGVTLGTTLSPIFRMRHIFREQTTAMATNDIGYKIWNNIADGVARSAHDSPEYARASAGGAYFHMGMSLQDNNAAYTKRLLAHGIDPGTVLDTMDKVKNFFKGGYEKWMELGERSDSITRANLYHIAYEKQIALGKSADEAHLLASYTARDAMDYGLRGTYAGLRMITQVMPFLNARIQGLYKLGRGAAADPRRFATVLVGMTMATIALSLYNRNDKDIQNASEFDRNNNLLFKVGGVMGRIPKTFEMGAFATIVDRAVETVMNGMDPASRERFAAQTWAILGSQLNLNPTGLAVIGPAMQLYANHNSFTQADIESEHDKTLSKPNRIGQNTTATAQLLGKAGNYTGLSPKQLDFIASALFGWVGTHAMALADVAVRPAMGMPDKPTRRIDDLFAVGDFVKQMPPDTSRRVEEVYAHSKVAVSAMADLHNYVKEGNLPAAREQALQADTQMAPMYSKAVSELAKINERIKLVQQSATMTPDAKRAEIDRLSQIKNDLADRVETARNARLMR